MPDQLEIDNYVIAMKQISLISLGCHSSDRYNLEALIECSYKKTFITRQLLTTVFMFENWAFAQTLDKPGQLDQCIDSGHQ